MKLKQKHGAGAWILGILLAGAVIVNSLAWISPTFCDAYVRRIFPYLTAAYGHLTSLVPFSVGEWMLILAVAWLGVLAGCSVIGIILCVARKIRKVSLRGTGYSKWLFRFWKTTLWIAVIVFWVMTLGCVIQYHCTPLERSLPGYGKEYNLDDLTALRDYAVEQCNTLAEAVPRDANGDIAYEGGEAAMGQEAGRSMEQLGEEFPQLAGFQVRPKPLYFSDFVSQQSMQGYYFPFSMEANYNELMQTGHKPSTMCHELAHTHGYIYEDEANLLGFLACVQSDDVVFQYSGWLDVLNYINNDFYRAVDRETYDSHVAISKQVWEDNEFLSEEARRKMEESAVFDTETVKEAASTYVDQTLKVNGVHDGKVSYRRVVGLILAYYDRNLQR